MSIVHWMIVIVIVVVLFGRHKISDLMGDVAQGIKSFKKGMQEDESTAVQSEDAVVSHGPSPTPSTAALAQGKHSNVGPISRREAAE